MPRLTTIAVLLLCVLPQGSGPAQAGTTDPFAFLRPAIELTAAERGRLAAGATVVRVLPGSDGQIAVFAASPLAAPPSQVLERMRRIELLKTGRFAPIVRRFSSPPTLADLAELELEESELDELRRCRPGRCGVKLAAAEMAALRERAAGPAWRRELQDAFRAVVLARAEAFLAGGYGALPSYEDHSRPVQPSAIHAGIAAAAPLRLEGVDGGESFLYWAKERAAGKPTITVSHVTLAESRAPGEPAALAISRQVYASHYMNGALGITAAVQSDDGRTFLVYINRTQVDVLGGLFGSLKRSIIERRIEGETAGVLAELRRRIEQPVAGGQ